MEEQQAAEKKTAAEKEEKTTDEVSTQAITSNPTTSLPPAALEGKPDFLQTQLLAKNKEQDEGAAGSFVLPALVCLAGLAGLGAFLADVRRTQRTVHLPEDT